jgi:hypothetical protein
VMLLQLTNRAGAGGGRDAHVHTRRVALAVAGTEPGPHTL